MPDSKNTRKKYYELASGNTAQVLVYGVLIGIFSVIIFFIFLPIFHGLIVNFLSGEVHSKKEILTLSIHDEPQYNKIEDYESWQSAMQSIISKGKILVGETDPYTNWAIDLSSPTAESVRYWVDPIVSLCTPSIIIGMLLASLITAWLPAPIGFIRRRIEREIVYNLDSICFISFGYYSEEKNDEIIERLLSADIHELHNLEQEWNTPIDNLKILINTLKWLNNNIVYKILHPLKGLNIYLRLYFTEKYNNAILGLVYMGASVLIVIIGLRGLKFIPPTHPSLIFFALGLEFTLLITYAFALIFAKPEELENIVSQDDSEGNKKSFMTQSNKDIERVLKVFIKTKK
jgi:hypothetical protein